MLPEKKYTSLYPSLMLLLLWIPFSMALGQEMKEVVIDPANPEFRDKFKEVSFDGKLALKVLNDETNDYYLLDLTRFRSGFEKVWFINLIFHEEKIVCIDHDLTGDRMWFLANRKYSEKEVLDLFTTLKEYTDRRSAQMTLEEKQLWMDVNDKYNLKGR